MAENEESLGFFGQLFGQRKLFLRYHFVHLKSFYTLDISQAINQLKEKNGRFISTEINQ